MKHDKLVKIISNELKLLGYDVKNEVVLPKGRGATDISCIFNEKFIFHGEVKESPTSINKKKVRQQLELYKDHFGDEYDYVLISPNGSGEIIFQNLSGNYRGNLEGYLLKFNH
jgi:cellulose biosynthesis protein BcsQ